MSFSRRYTRDQLIQLREKKKCHLKRPVRRRLFCCKILQHRKDKNTSHQETMIPVRITKRKAGRVKADGRVSHLKRIIFQNAPRPPKFKLPTFIFSNVRSLFNKTDLITLMMNQHGVDIGFFVETWLREDLPDASISIDGYNLMRKDRKGSFGGGLACYYNPRFAAKEITASEVCSMENCDSEFLPVFFSDLSLLAIICYHPFWNDNYQHEQAIECIVNIIDYAVLHETYKSNLRVLLVGDFNDLSKSYGKISDITGLRASVTFPTRGGKILDQLFSNFHSEYSAPLQLPPVGRSDHCSILWCPVINGPKFRKIQYSQSAREDFLEAMHGINWNDFFDEDSSLDSMIDQFQNCVK